MLVAWGDGGRRRWNVSVAMMAALAPAAALGCGAPPAMAVGSVGPADPGDPGDPTATPTPFTVDAEGCADIFAQDRLPTYEITASDDVWQAITTEFKTRYQDEAFGAAPRTRYPITFRYDGEEAAATIRLKGQSSWVRAATVDDPGKMQFVVAFDDGGSHGRFHGQRKIDLDMPRNDHTFLRQRVALAYLRSAGLPAQCANNARLVVNGTYYG